MEEPAVDAFEVLENGWFYQFSLYIAMVEYFDSKNCQEYSIQLWLLTLMEVWAS